MTRWHIVHTPMGEILLDENGKFVSRLVSQPVNDRLTDMGAGGRQGPGAERKEQMNTNPGRELAQGVNAYMKEHGCSYAVGLKEYTNSVAGARLWERYQQEAGSEALLSEANITGDPKAKLRRLKCEADHEAKGIRILDLVTGEPVGASLSRREVESALDRLASDAPRLAMGGEARHRAIAHMAEGFDENLALSAKLAEHFDNHVELDPTDPQHISDAVKAITKADPSLWREAEE